MSGGIVPVLFALLEFLRTVVGLWQLHIFRHWIVASMRSLESLGYTAEEKKGDEEDVGSDEKPAIDKKKRSRASSNLFRISDNFIIIDLVVDSRLSEGEIETIVRVRSSGANTNWRQRLRNWARWFSCAWYFPRLLVAICRSKEPLFSSPSAAM